MTLGARRFPHALAHAHVGIVRGDGMSISTRQQHSRTRMWCARFVLAVATRCDAAAVLRHVRLTLDVLPLCVSRHAGPAVEACIWTSPPWPLRRLQGALLGMPRCGDFLLLPQGSVLASAACMSFRSRVARLHFVLMRHALASRISRGAPMISAFVTATSTQPRSVSAPAAAAGVGAALQLHAARSATPCVSAML